MSSSSSRMASTKTQASSLMSSYDSSFESDVENVVKKRAREHMATKEERREAKAKRSETFDIEVTKEEGRRRRASLLSLNAYDRHKQLINVYTLSYPGSTCLINQRDVSKDRTDLDVLKLNHRFIWDDDDMEKDHSNDASKPSSQWSWGEQLARRYYSKLYREYCICDLSRYKEAAVAMRWRTHSELVEGKGHFKCGEKRCSEEQHLRTWEVHFGYVEQGAKKEALVKLRLCPQCSIKLNFRKRRREVTKVKKKKQKKHKKKSKRSRKEDDEEHDNRDETLNDVEESRASEIWSQPVSKEGDEGEAKSREDDFDTYLEDLFM